MVEGGRGGWQSGGDGRRVVGGMMEGGGGGDSSACDFPCLCASWSSLCALMLFAGLNWRILVLDSPIFFTCRPTQWEIRCC